MRKIATRVSKSGPHVRHHAPLESRNQAVFEAFDLICRTVTHKEYLTPRLKQIVECVEKFLWVLSCPRGSGYHRPTAHPRCGNIYGTSPAFLTDRVDKLVGEFFSRDVSDSRIRITRQHLVRNRMHQVRLAQTGFTVHEKGVVGPARRIRDCDTGCVCQLIPDPTTKFSKVFRG